MEKNIFFIIMRCVVCLILRDSEKVENNNKIKDLGYSHVEYLSGADNLPKHLK